MIKGAKETDLAAPFTFNLQLFAEGEAGAPAEAASIEPTHEGGSEYISDEPAAEQRRVDIDINNLDELGPDEPAEPTATDNKAIEPPPGNATPEDNAKWAQMRRDAEEAARLKQEIAERDKWVEENFGHTHDLHNWQEYQVAVSMTQKQQAQQQAASFDQETNAMIRQMQENGYDEVTMQLYAGQRALMKQNMELTQKLSTVENTSQQREQVQQEQLAQAQAVKRADELFAELQGEYSEFKDIDQLAQSMEQEAWNKIVEKVSRGYSLLDAYESTNRTALIQKKTEAAKQKTLNDLNSKKHLKTEGDGASEAAATTPLSPETLEMYMDSGMNEKQARAFHKKLYG